MSDVFTQYWYPIITAFHQGKSALPAHLGISSDDYHQITELVGLVPIATHELPQYAALQLRHELIGMRDDELNELTELLTEHIDHHQPYAQQMANVLANASMGSQHLWRDLGMPERPRLSQLFHDYFPTLHALNHHNMRWKRFLYKQLCESGGDYVCRSPSCETCTSYEECFGEER